MSNTNPADQDRGDPPGIGEPFTTGDEIIERAKRVAKKIEDQIRKLTDDTKLNRPNADSSDDSDQTDEMPPVS